MNLQSFEARLVFLHRKQAPFGSVDYVSVSDQLNIAWA